MLNSERLPDEVRKPFEPFLKQCLSVLGNNLRCAAIYGSATGTNFIKGVSDINAIFIVETLSFQDLEALQPVVAKGPRQKITIPLVMPLKAIERSLDVFPVEFLDIKEKHILVYGEDLISGWNIGTEHLRLFCEQQLKGKLLRIRQAYLEVGWKHQSLEALLIESLNSLIPIFRNLIRLKGEVPPLDKPAILKETGRLFGGESDVLVSIYRDKSKDAKIGKGDMQDIVRRYIKEIEHLARAVDGL